jgi:hypothetical protein
MFYMGDDIPRDDEISRSSHVQSSSPEIKINLYLFLIEMAARCSSRRHRASHESTENGCLPLTENWINNL